MSITCFNCHTVHQPDAEKRVTLCCDDPMIGLMKITTSADPKQWPEWVSGVMHKNTLEGVERAFSKEEWEAASEEVFSNNNYGWNMIVRCAIDNLRARIDE